MALLALDPAAQAAEWAAQAIINSDGYSRPGPVRWGKTSNEAAEKAVGACQQLYPSCGRNAATARVGTDKIFVTTCCNGGANCQVLATPLDEAAGRKAARNLTVKNVKAAGFPRRRLPRGGCPWRQNRQKTQELRIGGQWLSSRQRRDRSRYTLHSADLKSLGRLTSFSK